METKYLYGRSDGWIVCIAVTLLLFFAAIPFISLVHEDDARAFFFSGTLGEQGKRWSILLLYEAFFGFLAWLLYQSRLKNWLHSFIRPDYLIVGFKGLTYCLQDEDRDIPYSDIITCMRQPVYSIRGIAGYNLILVLPDGETVLLPLMNLAKPFMGFIEGIIFTLALFVAPFAFAFGMKKVAIPIVIAFIATNEFKRIKSGKLADEIAKNIEAHTPHLNRKL